MSDPATDLYHFLFDDPDPSVATAWTQLARVRARLQPLGLKGTTLSFLTLVVIDWVLNGRQPFLRFNRPCTHEAYRAGESWQERLGCGKQAFRTARRAVATKNVTGACLTELLADPALASLVIYWTDRDRCTHYLLNEVALAAQLSRVHDTALAISPSLCNGHSSPSLCSAGNPPLHRERLGTGGAAAQIQRETEGSQQPKPAFTLGRLGGGGNIYTDKENNKHKLSLTEMHNEIISRLERYGVYTGVSIRIAVRAVDHGLDPDATLDIFRTHLEAAQRDPTVKSPVGVTVWRMENLPLERPDAPTDDHPRRSRRGRPPREARADEPADDLPGMTVEEVERARRELDARLDAPQPEKEPTSAEILQQSIRLQMTPNTYKAHCSGMVVEQLTEEEIIFSTDHPHKQAWIDVRLQPVFKRAIRRTMGRDVPYRIVLREGADFRD